MKPWRFPHLLVPLLILYPNAAMGAWPQFRGPLGNGQADTTDLPSTWSEEENVVWKTAIHGRGWSSPVADEGRIWMTTATSDGKQMSAVCVEFAKGNILHDLKLLDVESPREIHKFNSYASPTPVIDGRRVYIHFGSYGTACLDAESGELLWSRRDLPCNHWRGPGSSPTIFENLLIMHFDGYDYQYVVALDKYTGETRWKKDREIDYGTDDGDLMKAFCTPIVIEAGGRLQLISPAAKATIAYDPRTGEEIWRVRYDQHSATARPVFGHDLVFLNTGFSKAELLAVRPEGQGDVTDTHVVWSSKRSIGSKPSHLLVEDLLYVVHDSGVLSCFEAKSGQTVWTHRLGGNFSASPVFAGGLMYFCSEEGETTVVRPGGQYDQVAVNQLDDGFMASPAVLEKSLILRTRSHLYRIEDR